MWWKEGKAKRDRRLRLSLSSPVTAGCCSQTVSGTDREDALLTPGKAQCSERGSFITNTSSIFLTLFRQMAPPWFLFHLYRGPTYTCMATGGLGQSTWRGLAGSGSSIKPSATSPTPSTSTSNHHHPVFLTLPHQPPTIFFPKPPSPQAELKQKPQGYSPSPV